MCAGPEGRRRLSARSRTGRALPRIRYRSSRRRAACRWREGLSAARQTLEPPISRSGISTAIVPVQAGTRAASVSRMMGGHAVSTTAAPVGRTYSQAIVVGNLVFVAGTAGKDLASGTWPAGVVAQMEQALKNLSVILAEAGCSLDDVVKTTTFITPEAYAVDEERLGPRTRICPCSAPQSQRDPRLWSPCRGQPATTRSDCRNAWRPSNPMPVGGSSATDDFGKGGSGLAGDARPVVEIRNRASAGPACCRLPPQAVTRVWWPLWVATGSPAAFRRCRSTACGVRQFG